MGTTVVSGRITFDVDRDRFNAALDAGSLPAVATSGISDGPETDRLGQILANLGLALRGDRDLYGLRRLDTDVSREVDVDRLVYVLTALTKYGVDVLGYLIYDNLDGLSFNTDGQGLTVAPAKLVEL